MNRLAHALCVTLGLSTAFTAISQMPVDPVSQAAIELESHQDSGPAVITSIRVDGREVGTNTFSIPPGEQWLKHLSVSVTNKSSQVINGVDVQLIFPETGTGSRDHPMTGYQCQWGSTPASRTNAPIMGHNAPASLRIAPSDTAELDLGKHFSEYANLLASHMGSSAPRQVRLVITLVDFANNVEWGGNAFFSVSPNGTHTLIDRKDMF